MKLDKFSKAAIILTAVIAGTAAAYAAFSGSTSTVTNTFSIVYGEDGASGDEVGSIDEGEIWEKDEDGNYIYDDNDNGIPDPAEDLAPNESVSKAPAITSYVDYDTWAFMEVFVPTISAYIDNVEGVYDIVTLEGLDTDNWELVTSSVSDSAGTDSFYVYIYTSPIGTDESTTSLFTSIKVQDFSSISYDDAGSKNLNIIGRLIQYSGNETIYDASVSGGYIDSDE